MWRQQTAQIPTFSRKLSLHLNVFQNIFFYIPFKKILDKVEFMIHLLIKKSEAWKVQNRWRDKTDFSSDSAVWIQPVHLSLGAKGHNSEADNPFVSEVQTIWGPGSSYIWGADQVGPGTLSHLGSNLEGPEPVSRSLLISCFLSRQDFTSAHSNPVILHCEPYKCGSWNPWPKGTAWEKVTRKALLIDLEHCLPSKIQPIRLA